MEDAAATAITPLRFALASLLHFSFFIFHFSFSSSRSVSPWQIPLGNASCRSRINCLYPCSIRVQSVANSGTCFSTNPHTMFMATRTMSISLMPTKGTMTPPNPQNNRLRRSRASAPTGRYLTPFSAWESAAG